MSARTKLTIFFLVLTTLFFVVAMASPWWFRVVEGYPVGFLTSRSVCFIDGTCRSGSWVYKDNGGAQVIFDATLALMILALVPYLTFVHAALWKINKRVLSPSRRTGRPLLIVSGLLTMLLVLSAVLTFAVGIVNKTDSGELFGEIELPYPYTTVEWGATWGWFMAIIVCVFMIPLLALSVSLKDHVGERTRLLSDNKKVVAQYVAEEAA